MSLLLSVITLILLFVFPFAQDDHTSTMVLATGILSDHIDPMISVPHSLSDHTHPTMSVVAENDHSHPVISVLAGNAHTHCMISAVVRNNCTTLFLLEMITLIPCNVMKIP